MERGHMEKATMVSEPGCSEAACGGTAVTSLDQQALCLNHFLLQCYARLEALDPRAAKSRREPIDLPVMRAFIEECSRKALDVSLQSDNLSNLERGRLLDILLWAGELFLLLRAPIVGAASPGASASASTDSTEGARVAISRL